MRKTRKPVALGLAVALVAAVGIGATVAYLTDEDAVTNTFTVGNVGIDLYEHDYDPEGAAAAADQVGALNMEKEVEGNADYKLVPGVKLPKDPTVRVDEGSEECWLFVEVVPTNNTAASGAEFVQWGIDGTVWEQLKVNGSAVENVFYALYDGDEAKFNVLAGKQVTVNPAVVKTDMDAIDGVNADGSAAKAEVEARPSLSFTAYAVQKAGFDTAEKAWTEGLGK